jgi:hypothetical protein
MAVNDLALLALAFLHAGPLRLDALAAQPAMALGTWGARATVEYPQSGPIRTFSSVSGASYGRPEMDITLRAGLALDVGPRLEIGWQGTDLETEDTDGGPRSWASISLAFPEF